MYRLDAADEQRADQDHGHAAERCREVADQSLVARENAGYSPRCRGIHTEELAGYVHVIASNAGVRHMNAVIVVRCEVDACKAAAAIRSDSFGIAREQLL